MAISDEQRAGLWKAKLTGLARDHFDRTTGTTHELPWGAALENDGVWTALIEVAPARSFGQALVLATRNGATKLDLLVEGEQASHVARRAQLFEPSPVVHQLIPSASGIAVQVAEPTVFTPIVAAQLRPDLADLLDVPHVEVIVEHGVIIGECLGLEVARITGVGDEQRLDVGVGAYDQGAFAVMNPELTPDQALTNVVTQVLESRRSGALPHPINRLARERWIRSVLLGDPASIGLSSLTAVEPINERDGIKDTAATAALGLTVTDERVLVACTVGIDLDVVPTAADLAELHNAERIVVVLPDRDRHALLQSVAALSHRPVEFVTAPEPWNG